MPRAPAVPVEVRVWKFLTEGPVDECWPWRGAKTEKGYGRIRDTAPARRMVAVHRVVWEIYFGPSPPGTELDHLCRNPPCGNPFHLEPVTHKVNTLRGEAPTADNARKTHCPVGHPYDAANTYISPEGWRQCKTCRRDYQRMLRAR